MGLPTRLSDASIPDEKFGVMAEKSVKTGSIKKLNTDDVVEIYKIAV
jgi:alcohol dehydrogenase YqhD (iron-dependent ADH family)